MRHLVLVFAAASMLAGCATTFLPSFNQAIFNELESANKSIALIDAAAKTAPTLPISYDKVEPYYTAALASLSRASAIANSRYNAVSSRPSADAASTVLESIDTCQKAVVLLMEQNKKQPISGDTFKDSSITQNCEITKSMENLLPKGKS